MIQFLFLYVMKIRVYVITFLFLNFIENSIKSKSEQSGGSDGKLSPVDKASNAIREEIQKYVVSLRTNLEEILQSYKTLLEQLEDLMGEEALAHQEGDVGLMDQIIRDQDVVLEKMDREVFQPLVQSLNDMQAEGNEQIVLASIETFKTTLATHMNSTFPELVSKFGIDLANQIQEQHIQAITTDLEKTVNKEHDAFKQIFIKYYDLLDEAIEYPGDQNPAPLEPFTEKYEAFKEALAKNDETMINMLKKMMESFKTTPQTQGGSGSSRKPKAVARNPMQYYIKKYVQSGGDPKNGRAVRTYVKDLLKNNDKLGERVVAYGKAHGIAQ